MEILFTFVPINQIIQVSLPFILSIEILISFFLKITSGDKVHMVITATTAQCYLMYIIIPTAFEDLQTSFWVIGYRLKNFPELMK